MWKRNLLFVSLIVGGVGALGANLMPPREPRPITRYDARAYRADDLRSTVDRVDESFRRVWAERKIEPSALADELTVARRLALGLMGTIPSLEEIRQFEWLPRDERLPWWIDHILQDQRFADYFAERLARSYVGTEGGPFILYRRRRFVNWLSDQIAKKRPYDAIVRDLIDSEGLWTNQPATNFITVTSQQNKKNQPDPIRLAGRVTRAFLGLRLDCAECHDHPYNPRTQADFHGLAAFFGQVHLGFTGIYDGQGEFEYAPPGKPDKKRTIEPRVPFSPELLPEEGTRRGRLAAWVTHENNPYFSRAIVNRVWALLFGRPLVEPVDELDVDPSNPPPGVEALDTLARDLVEHRFDLRRLIRVIASTQVFRLDSGGEPVEPNNEPDREKLDLKDIEAGECWAYFPLTRLRPEQVAGSVIQLSSVTTINADSHIFVRLARITNQNDFLERYGDSGEDEFTGRSGTIPQRLLLMNGQLTRERIKEDLFTASSRIAGQAPDDRRAVEAAYLTVLTRRPTAEESDYFEQKLADKNIRRQQRLEDFFWSLLNSTEFSWNH